MLSKELLLKTLHYNKEIGVFTWRVKPSNCIAIGDIAGTIKCDGKGRLNNQITIGGNSEAAARLAWLYVTGKEPIAQIDHIDGNSLNDKWDNLRDISNMSNCKNQSLCTNNTSGCMGVTWFKPSSSWQVRINIEGKRKCLGYFNSLDEAIAIRKQAEKENGYHINHGRTK